MKKIIIAIVLILIFTACMARVKTVNGKESRSKVVEVVGEGEWLLKGSEALKAENHDKAIECFLKAIAITPNDARAHYNLGIAYSKKGMLDESMAEYKKAIGIDPKFAEAHNNLGNVYGTKGMIDEEISEYKKAITLNPNLTEAHNNLGFVYSERGMLDEAITEYKQAIAINPNHVLAHNNLGIAYNEKGMLAEAISEFKRTISIDPNNALAHHILGIAYNKKGLNSLAAEHYYKAGLLYIKRGDRENALKAYEDLKLTHSEEEEKALFEKLHPELEQKKSEPSE